MLIEEVQLPMKTKIDSKNLRFREIGGKITVTEEMTFRGGSRIIFRRGAPLRNDVTDR